jgi:two-component system sensor histidine kinase KdpD
LCLVAHRGHRLRVHERQVLETLVSAAALAIERAQLAAEERAAAVARESDRLKSALLSTVSHELRTPLASIKATTSGLLEGDVSYDTAMLRQFLNGIDGEADRLIRLVSNLLDVSRIEAGSLRPDRDWYDLEELIGTGLDALRPHLAGHRIVRAIAPDLPLVWCDYVQILQVLTNLLENAARYAPAGTTITVAACADGDEVLLTVSDEGPGVGVTERATIFDAFVRGSAAGERSGGVGLGLAISKGMVVANGGRIWVDAAPGGGAAFAVALPCRRDGHRSPSPAHDGADAQVAGVGATNLSGAVTQHGGGS